MAKIRLNQTHREALRRFAREHVACVPEQKARDTTYRKASTGVRRDVEKQFPTTDMEILARYKVAKPDTCIRGGSPSGQFTAFTFDSKEDAPFVPDRCCSSRSISFAQSTVTAIEAFEVADAALKKAREAKLAAYEALITSARTFEEVVEIWPAAAALADRIGAPSTAIVALSEDVAALIRNDNAGAAEAA